MRIARLRSVGGSTMVAIPPHIIEQLRLAPKDTVGISVENGKIIIRPNPPHGRIGLKARLKMCDFSKPPTKEEREWLRAPGVGREEI